MMDNAKRLTFELCKTGDKEGLLKMLKKLGKDGIQIKDESDQTLLHVAAEWGHTDVVIVLLERFKIPVSPIDKNGWAPLHSAATQGRLEICEILLDRGAFAPAATTEGTTALHYLSRFDIGLKRDMFRRVVQKFLQGGADLNAQNRHGLTPLHEAALRGNVSVVQVLREFPGLALDAKTSQGETALIYAARGNFPHILNVLLDAGADASIAGSDGTALEVAVEMNRREAAKALRARVRDPCKLCGRPFYPLCFHVIAPKIWEKFTDEQKAHRNMRLSADLCQVHEDVFIRGILEIPIASSNATMEISASSVRDSFPQRKMLRHPLAEKARPGQLFLRFGVFVQVSRASFDLYVKNWNLDGREIMMEGPIEGFIANLLPYWKSSLNLQCKLYVQKVGCRPIIEVSDASHPLYAAQREGISFATSETIKNMI